MRTLSCRLLVLAADAGARTPGQGLPFVTPLNLAARAALAMEVAQAAVTAALERPVLRRAGAPQEVSIHTEYYLPEEEVRFPTEYTWKG